MHVCVFANARMLKCQRTYVTLPTHLCAPPPERGAISLRKEIPFLPKEINFSSEGNGNYITSEWSFLGIISPCLRSNQAFPPLVVLARLEDEEVKASFEGERQDGVACPQASLVDDFTGGREHSQMPVRG